MQILVRITVQVQVQVNVQVGSGSCQCWSQGGSLDLHPSTGLAAIEAMGLWDEFQKHARYEGEELVFADKNGTELIHMKEAADIGGFEARPEIDREKLKTILLESVNPEWICWGKHLQRVTEDGILSFSDGTTEGPYDLIVGAEGA
jgi:2-polyprenyl-6-methoxyphenol hydroxylase-like FAD-dependent oxidoreductase